MFFYTVMEYMSLTVLTYITCDVRRKTRSEVKLRTTCGVEVTKLSTNKQHTFSLRASLQCAGNHLLSRNPFKQSSLRETLNCTA
jgi:hypothetical protein